MNNLVLGHHQAYRLRWFARIWSIFSVGLLLLFIIGEGFSAALTPLELTLFIFFPIGVGAGMILAWWQEGWGGALTVICLLLFYLLEATASGNLAGGLSFLLFSAPGFLFLGLWLLERRW